MKTKQQGKIDIDPLAALLLLAMLVFFSFMGYSAYSAKRDFFEDCTERYEEDACQQAWDKGVKQFWKNLF